MTRRKKGPRIRLRPDDPWIDISRRDEKPPMRGGESDDKGVSTGVLLAFAAVGVLLFVAANPMIIVVLVGAALWYRWSS